MSRADWAAHREAIISWLVEHPHYWNDPGIPFAEECKEALQKAGLFSRRTNKCDIHIDRYILDPRCQALLRKKPA